MSVEISGKGFLFDAAGTVPFFREGDIPDEAIVDTLSQIKRTYEATGRSVSDKEWEAVINHYNLPTPSEVVPKP
ncbi:MAG: hypothetical protein ACC618_01245 [Patescibacteria group bacterium]